MADTGEALKSKQATARIFETSEDLTRAVAEGCGRLALEMVEVRGSCSIALADGSTPRRLYALQLQSPSEMLRCLG